MQRYDGLQTYIVYWLHICISDFDSKNFNNMNTSIRFLWVVMNLNLDLPEL
jgi:hypothetical protein